MTDKRTDLKIPSHGETLAAWFYPGTGTSQKPGSCMVLAHGLGAVKEMGLDRYAERFSAAGHACLVFDYRCFGGSTGKPRSLVNWEMQQQDWEAAISFAKDMEQVDPDKIAIFGTSFSGGHVIELAAKHPELKAAISQCPFTDGGARTGAKSGVFTFLGFIMLALRDFLFGTDDKPVRVKLVGEPGSGKFRHHSSGCRTLFLTVYCSCAAY
jgi:uncharacterized protein